MRDGLGSTAAARAEFAARLLRPGMRVLDVGCGAGVISRMLATSVPDVRVVGVDEVNRLGSARSIVDFVGGSVYALPLADGAVDLAFAHGLFDHLRDPAAALAELHRVVRPGGRLALSTSDWSRAKLRPRTANVDAALRGYYLLRRRQGADPFAGKRLADLVTAAGFAEVRSHARFRGDVAYRDLARQVEAALAAALDTPSRDHQQLTSAARSAWVWSRAGDGEFNQCWVELTATR
nr:methyltransferase domain-containing protein [Amycolatopsis suaedae]